MAILTEERSKGIKKPASPAINRAIFFCTIIVLKNPYGQVGACSAIKVTKQGGGAHSPCYLFISANLH
jgi:hypothetical protein